MSRIEKVCEGCAEFRMMEDDHRFCSRSCHMRHRNTDSAEQARKGRLGGIAHAKLLAGTAQPHVYPKGGNNHRAVATRLLGRPLQPGEVVHHEDRNKHNNEPSNLVVFPSQADHARHHKLGHCGAPCTCPGIRLGGDAR